ncbi:MAG: hypothetical protein F4Z05_07190 [Chloroflexi bacterium]|nr:hypothetical protein [Chloroflexota bacterium]
MKLLVENYDAGVAGDFDAGIPPITRFQSVDDVEQIANNLELASGLGLTGPLVEMVGVFYELALNAVEHSQWAGGYYVTRADNNIVGSVEHTVGIADCGIGIPASLRRNSAFADVLNDPDAIALATDLHVTGTGEAHRGIGLDHVMNVVKSLSGSLTIISAGGSLNVEPGGAIMKGNLEGSERLAGTVAVVTISVPA